jgi:predicted amidohydrolase YtcJ
VLLDALYTNGAISTPRIFSRPARHTAWVYTAAASSASITNCQRASSEKSMTSAARLCHSRLQRRPPSPVLSGRGTTSGGSASRRMPRPWKPFWLRSRLRVPLHPPASWVIGAGYDQNYLAEVHPTAELLDRVSNGHPVWLMHNSRHMGVGNTEAFARAGFPERRNVPIPEGGAFAKDSRRQGNSRLAAGDGTCSDHGQHSRALRGGHRRDGGSGKSAGLGSGDHQHHRTWDSGAPAHVGHSVSDLGRVPAGARHVDSLGVRATVMPYLTALHRLGEDADAPFGLDLGLRSGMGDEWLRIGPVKVLSDGSMIGRSAFMCCDYPADAAAGISNRGLLQFPEHDLRTWLIGAHSSDWQVAVHAIGDAALNVVPWTFWRTPSVPIPREDTRHRIEHLSSASDDQLKRAASLGLVGVPQGRFISELGDGVIRAVGAGPRPLHVPRQRSAGRWAWRSLPAPTPRWWTPNPHLEHSRSGKPPNGIGRRIRARGAHQCAAQAVRAYTVGSAYAVHEEKYKGTLAHGMLADFVTLSEDIYQVATRKRSRTSKSPAPIVGGRQASAGL